MMAISEKNSDIGSAMIKPSNKWDWIDEGEDDLERPPTSINDE